MAIEATYRPPRVYTAAQLQAIELPQVTWAVPQVLPEGLTLFAGRPKRGKSWLALGLAVAVASGGHALGQIPVEPGEVLLLALEDTPRRLQARLATLLMGEPGPANLKLETQWPRLDQDQGRELRSWLKMHPGCRLVIIDTIKKIRSRTVTRGANVYDVDYEATEQLKAIADEARCGMLAIHHTRKLSSDDPFETVSGSYGLTGGVDTIWVLDRKPNSRDATLHLTGRDVEEDALSIRWEPEFATWKLVGDSATAQLSDERKELLAMVRRTGPINLKVLANHIGWPYERVKITAWRMANAGQLISEGNGVYKAPSQLPL